MRKSKIKIDTKILKEAIQNCELKASVIAERAGVERKTLLDYCNGRTNPSLSAIKLIAQALNVNEENFYKKTEAS